MEKHFSKNLARDRGTRSDLRVREKKCGGRTAGCLRTWNIAANVCVVDAFSRVHKRRREHRRRRSVSFFKVTDHENHHHHRHYEETRRRSFPRCAAVSDAARTLSTRIRVHRRTPRLHNTDIVDVTYRAASVAHSSQPGGTQTI